MIRQFDWSYAQVFDTQFAQNGFPKMDFPKQFTGSVLLVAILLAS